METYWTYALEGNPYYDADFTSCDKCIEAMDEDFAERFEGEGLKNGDVRTCDAEIIRFQYNGDGEREILHREFVEARYEHYHGDLAEHGTYY